jgi:aryl-alcohol dehydrogenase-like predicted oxidoreductase
LVLSPGFQPRYIAPRTSAATADYAALAKAHALTPTQLALGWAGSRWYMGSVIIGATTLEQLEENAAACNLTLSEEVLKGIQELWLKHGNTNLND